MFDAELGFLALNLSSFRVAFYVLRMPRFQVLIESPLIEILLELVLPTA